MDQEKFENKLVNPIDFSALKTSWVTAEPFHHVVIDSFLNSITADDVVTPTPVQALSSTLDRDDPKCREGDVVPPLWHWLRWPRGLRDPVVR